MRTITAASVIHEFRLQFVDTAVLSLLFTDNGSPASSEFKDFFQRWGIRHITSSTYYQ